MRNKVTFIVFTGILLCNFFFSTLFANAQTLPANIVNPTPLPTITPIPTPVSTPTPILQVYLSVQEDPQNQLGLIYSVKKIEEATNLFNEGKIDEAEKKLNEIKNWLIDATDLHYKLHQTLSKNSKTLDKAKVEKAHALDFGNLRDQAFYLLAKIYINQNKLKDAVKMLTEVVQSQPESELGRNAYKTLIEIKFSD